jgi:hypothetical protein
MQKGVGIFATYSEYLVVEFEIPKNPYVSYRDPLRGRHYFQTKETIKHIIIIGNVVVVVATIYKWIIILSQ